jgi:flagellar motor switch protein FliN
MAAAAQPKPDSRLEAAAVDATGTAATVSAVDSKIDPWSRLETLPCLLTIEILVPGFTVGDLVHLYCGRTISTGWTVGQDVPLRINGELIAWSEFEILKNRMAVRLTELA